MKRNVLSHPVLRRGKAAFLSLLLLLVGTSCSTAENIDKTDGSQPAAITHQLEYLSDRPETDGYSSKDGYYRIVSRENATANLLYIDYATNKEIFLCNQPNCSHDSESCPSFIPFSNGVMRPIPVGDKVVLLHGGNPSYADFLGEDALAKVEILNADGSDRRTIINFSTTEQISQLPRGGLARDEHHVYFVLTDIVENTRTLYRVDVSTETAEAIYPFDQDEERIVACSGDDLVIAYTPNASDLSLDATQLETSLFRLNPDTKKETPLFTYPYTSQYAFDGELFVTLSNDGVLKSYDLATGECSFENTIATPIDFMLSTFYGCVDGHLLVSAFDMPEDPEALAEEIMQSGYYVPHYYAIDIRTGKVKELPYLYYQTALGDAFTYQEGDVCFIAAETEDQYLCCNQMNTIVVDFPRNDGTVVELPYNTPSYAMISKDSFWDGSGALVPVEVIS